MVLNIKTMVLWIVMPCGLVEEYQCFGGVSLCEVVFQETTTFSLAVHQVRYIPAAVSGCNNTRTINSGEKYSNSRTQAE
jgi:hypothetical protein